MKRLIYDKQIEAINRKWNCGGNGHFDWANEIEAVVRAEAEAKVELARHAMEAFTPAIDAALWIALQWNDHNHDAETIFAHAKRAADGLCLQRGGPDARDELFALWNAALSGLKVDADRTAPEGHNAALRGAEPASSAERPLEGTVMQHGGEDEKR